MASEKISVTVDAETLADVRRLAGSTPLSVIVDGALRAKAARMRLLDVLADWERTDPIGAADRAEADRLWNALGSSSTPAPSRRSRGGKSRSAPS